MKASHVDICRIEHQKSVTFQEKLKGNFLIAYISLTYTKTTYGTNPKLHYTVKRRL